MTWQLTEEALEAARFNRAWAEVRGVRIVDAEQAEREGRGRLRIPAAEVRYRALRPGDRVEIRLTRAGAPDEALWCWVQAICPGDEPRLFVTLDAQMPGAEAYGPYYGDCLILRPREIFRAERYDDAALAEFAVCSRPDA